MKLRPNIKFPITSCLWVLGMCLVPQVIAQVREDREILLAPALEVFSGNGTPEEIYYVTVLVAAGGLLVAVVAANVVFLMKKMTFKLLVKIFTLWFVFAAGISTVSLSYYLTQPSAEPIIRADEEARPRQIRVKISQDVVTVIWRTAKQTRGQVVYVTDLTSRDQVLLSNAAQPTGEHQVVIPLDEGVQRIELSIVSDGVEYRQEGERLVVELQ